MAPNLNEIQKYKWYVDIRFAKYHYKEYQSTGKNVLNNDRVQKTTKDAIRSCYDFKIKITYIFIIKLGLLE